MTICSPSCNLLSCVAGTTQNESNHRGSPRYVEKVPVKCSKKSNKFYEVALVENNYGLYFLIKEKFFHRETKIEHLMEQVLINIGAAEEFFDCFAQSLINASPQKKH